MDDATFELFQRYLHARMRTLNLKQEQILDLFKLDWLVLNDPTQMQRVVNEFELGASKAARDSQDLARPALDARISELEEATKPKELVEETPER